MPLPPLISFSFYCEDCKWHEPLESEVINFPEKCPQCGSHSIGMRREQKITIIDLFFDVFK